MCSSWTRLWTHLLLIRKTTTNHWCYFFKAGALPSKPPPIQNDWCVWTYFVKTLVQSGDTKSRERTNVFDWVLIECVLAFRPQSEIIQERGKKAGEADEIDFPPVFRPGGGGKGLGEGEDQKLTWPGLLTLGAWGEGVLRVRSKKRTLTAEMFYIFTLKCDWMHEQGHGHWLEKEMLLTRVIESRVKKN